MPRPTPSRRADLLLKGEGEEADNIVGGPEWSTLANDAFPSREFDFMLSNPPYGKSWKSDQERMGGKGGMRDPRFVIEHAGDAEYGLVTRSSDGQMLFLANMLSKMKRNTPLGSRIAEVHNGSSLFTGMLAAAKAMSGAGSSRTTGWKQSSPCRSTFYNTGIGTYVWVLSNRKPGHRRGRVQLIDATDWFKPLRKNLGKKNCELADADIERIVEAFLNFEETEQSRIFDNAEFGYSKVTVERPLRAKGIDGTRAYAPKEIKALKEEGRTAEDGAPVIRRIHKSGKVEADPLRGLFPATIEGKRCIVEYEPDSDLRDTETVPLTEPGGIEAFIRREVLPHAPDAWIDEGKTTIGYEISFTRYFYKPLPLRPLDAIRADILALERETDGLMAQIIGAR
jgi:type I restriction enzyme M protein